jgi:hypothetical protein
MDSEEITRLTGSNYPYNYSELPEVASDQHIVNYCSDTRALFAPIAKSFDDEDPRFLVASHIARWADNESLRGDFGNGLCLCLMHDKAFELGLFTLNDQFEIVARLALLKQHCEFSATLESAQGKQIRLATIVPLKEALSEHRKRVSLRP